jgi:hypothetical protein
MSASWPVAGDDIRMGQASRRHSPPASVRPVDRKSTVVLGKIATRRAWSRGSPCGGTSRPRGARGTAAPPGLRLVLNGLPRGSTADPGSLARGLPPRQPLGVSPAQVCQALVRRTQRQRLRRWRPTPRACAQVVPVGRPAPRASPAAHVGRRPGGKSSGPRAWTAARSRRSWPNSPRHQASVGTGAPGDGRGSWPMTGALPHPPARPRAVGGHRGGRGAPGRGWTRPAPRSLRRPASWPTPRTAWSARRRTRA